MIESAIYSILASAVAGTAISEKVYYLRAPSSAELPYIIYLKISDSPTSSIAGTENYNEARIQIKIIAAKGFDCLEIREILRDNIINYRGKVGDIRIWNIYIDDDKPEINDEVEENRQIIDILIEYSREYEQKKW